MQAQEQPRPQPQPQPPTDAATLLRLRLEMEFGIRVPADSITLPAPTTGTGQNPPPRVIISHHRDGLSVFTRDDLPATVRQAITTLAEEAQPEFPEEHVVAALLPKPDAPASAGGGEAHAEQNIWRVCWYTIDALPTPDAYADSERLGESGEEATTFVIRQEGQPVARAWTTADSPRATEVEVETHPDFRRRGYGRQVVAAWSAQAISSGKAVFYSHLRHNDASRAVAASLGLSWLSDEVEFE